MVQVSLHKNYPYSSSILLKIFMPPNCSISEHRCPASFVSLAVLQAMKSWVGPGNEARGQDDACNTPRRESGGPKKRFEK